MNHPSGTRRSFLRNTALLSLIGGLPACRGLREKRQVLKRPVEPIDDEDAHLVISDTRVVIAGRETWATTVGTGLPGPLVRLVEGQEAVLSVTNLLDVDSSIHWHGVILPAAMDGVPGVSFAGIKPGETFTYRFPVTQSGTYWYHSHSGLQEQTGVFGALVIDPKEPDPVAYDRDYVVTLSDWTFESPYRILKLLKKQPGYYNYQRQTLLGLMREAEERGLGPAWEDRMRWARMRMDPTDIADITGHTYTYLVNGTAPEDNWTALFRPGERVRLRFINAAAASYFDVRIPGLEMTVVQVDGQYVQPVRVEEFRIAIAETVDVIVQPQVAGAFTLFAEAMDRSGFARGTLASESGLSADVPARRRRPLLSMADMGMSMGATAMAMDDGNRDPMDQNAMAMGEASEPERSMPGGVPHGPDHHGPGNTRVATVSRERLDEPGLGLGDAGRRVLVYSDLRSLRQGGDPRPPGREMELHLTGNMERYMWSFDGLKYSEVAGPILFRYGERLRLTLVNDTMMNHPIHLHGMWMELDVGAGRFNPRKHTINVKPAERVSVNISVDAPGNWAFHCHILYHMDMGMFRVVAVVGSETEERHETHS